MSRKVFTTMTLSNFYFFKKSDLSLHIDRKALIFNTSWAIVALCWN